MKVAILVSDQSLEIFKYPTHTIPFKEGLGAGNAASSVDISHFQIDYKLLETALAKEQDVTSEFIPWDKPGITWTDYDAALIYSPWNYLVDRDGFLQKLKQIEQSGTLLLN